jgi:predicted nucleic acid-binding protein
MTREVTLDANVIVAHLDDADALSRRAQALARRLREQGADLVLLDVLVGEAVSVLCLPAGPRKAKRSTGYLGSADDCSWVGSRRIHTLDCRAGGAGGRVGS